MLFTKFDSHPMSQNRTSTPLMYMFQSNNFALQAINYQTCRRNFKHIWFTFCIIKIHYCYGVQFKINTPWVFSPDIQIWWQSSIINRLGVTYILGLLYECIDIEIHMSYNQPNIFGSIVVHFFSMTCSETSRAFMKTSFREDCPIPL